MSTSSKRYLYFSATPISLIIERVFLLVYCLVELFYSESVEMKNVKKINFQILRFEIVRVKQQNLCWKCLYKQKLGSLNEFANSLQAQVCSKVSTLEAS